MNTEFCAGISEIEIFFLGFKWLISSQKCSIPTKRVSFILKRQKRDKNNDFVNENRRFLSKMAEFISKWGLLLPKSLSFADFAQLKLGTGAFNADRSMVTRHKIKCESLSSWLPRENLTISGDLIAQKSPSKSPGEFQVTWKEDFCVLKVKVSRSKF